MRLKETVRFFRFDDLVYVRDTDTATDYLYNEIVYDILQFLSRSPGCTVEQLLRTLSEHYAVEDPDAFRADITAFLEELGRERLLLEDKNAAEELPILDLSGQIQQLCADRHRLFQACLELTYRCNERCVHCYLDEQSFGKELELDTYRAILDELADMGCPSLLLTGGEVSLHPNFPEIAEYASGKGFLVNIYTNGLALPDSALQRLIALHPNSISFSFYGSGPEVHDLVTGVPGSFERSLRTMLMCKCAGVDTFIKTVALKQNAADLEALFQLGQRLNIPVSLAKLVLPSVHGTKNSAAYKLERAEDFSALFRLEEKYQHTAPHKREQRGGDRFFCSAGVCTLSIDPYGEVYPCSSLRTSLGNVKQHALRELWDRSAEKLDEILPREKLAAQCETCAYAAYCSVCPAALLREAGGLQCSADICTIARGAYQFASQTEHV